MTHFIGCDVHKKYSVFAAVDEQGVHGPVRRVEHDREGFRSFLSTLPPAFANRGGDHGQLVLDHR